MLFINSKAVGQPRRPIVT